MLACGCACPWTNRQTIQLPHIEDRDCGFQPCPCRALRGSIIAALQLHRQSLSLTDKERPPTAKTPASGGHCCLYGGPRDIGLRPLSPGRKKDGGKVPRTPKEKRRGAAWCAQVKAEPAPRRARFALGKAVVFPREESGPVAPHPANRRNDPTLIKKR